MRTPVLVILGFSALCLTRCQPGHAYDKYIKELDSLKIVVEQALDNFYTIDSTTCYGAWSKCYTYRIFLTSHLKDTVSKSTAESLQYFFATEKPLEDYLAMRPVWTTEARTSIKQVSLLSNDLKNGSVETSEAVGFISDEQKRSEKIIEELKRNTTLIRKHLELHAQHLPVVEQLIRTINAGQLPSTFNQK